ncbi:DNA-binding protein [Bacteroidia bacterium]|nr:DNA-binding protein [Bacteroidia bacterium]
MKYNVNKRVDPRNPQRPKIQSATPVNAGKVTLEDLAEETEARTSLSRGDVESVLTTTMQILPFYLKLGLSVQLGDIGTMRLSINSEGVPVGETFKHTNIKGVRTIFTPSVELKENLKNTSFEEFKPGEHTSAPTPQTPDIENPPAPDFE